MATQDSVASENITEEGSSVRGETEVVKESISNEMGLQDKIGLIVPNRMSIILFVPLAILFVS